MLCAPIIKRSRLATYGGSLLAAERRFGLAGGPAGVVGLSLLADDRAPEVTPGRGGLTEVSARYAPPLSSPPPAAMSRSTSAWCGRVG
ncbi:MAG: hypothetical protein FJ138_17225 [Deltaproteobacteria bacterium]|nr:hypothetical protein [Deltaproteobacteria bacterium]